MFRDPPPVEEAAARLKLRLAKTLVGAETMPVELPRFGLRLLEANVSGREVELVLGLEDPIAVLRISPTERRGTALVQLGTAAVTVRAEERQPEAQRFARQLDAMVKRLVVAITPARWEAASALIDELATLPLGLPLQYFRDMVSGIDRLQGLVRTGFRCNQDCGLCWQGRSWAAYDGDQIVRWIEDLHAAGARHLIISGGEPTIDRQLFRYVERARQLGFDEISLETNAIQFAKAGFAEQARVAGVTECFVSLHSGDAVVSDALTRAPGTFARTILGIRALHEAGISVRLNCVLTAAGLEHVAGLPDFIHDTFGRGRSITFTLPSSPFDQTQMSTLMPDPTRLRAVLSPLLDRALELGLDVGGLDGPCGPPLCAFGADPRVASLRPLEAPVSFRHKIAACEGCAVASACFGVRGEQVELYGDACVAPIARRPPRDDQVTWNA